MCAHAVVSDSATPWTVACQSPLSMEFSRQEYWNGLPFPTPMDFFNPGIKSTSLESPALSIGSLPPNSKSLYLFIPSSLYPWASHGNIYFKIQILLQAIDYKVPKGHRTSSMSVAPWLKFESWAREWEINIF